MKNKYGFTLIELLAVIVVLAIIALISVPILLNVIDKSKRGTLQDSAYGIIEAGELYYAQNLKSSEDTTRYDFEVKNNEFVNSIDNTKKLPFKGSMPKTGTLQINGNGKTAVAICTDKYCACKSISELKVTVKDTNCNIDPETGLIEDSEIAKDDSTPAGTIISFGGKNAPDEYLICDGSEVSRTDYADLYVAIGDTYGAGDGSTTFKLPDLRGEFLRGSGTNSHSGQGSGAAVGTHQNGTEDPFVFGYFYGTDGWIGITNAASSQNFVTEQDSFNATKKNLIAYSQSGGHYSTGTLQPVSYTSRPTNTSVLYCIKY